MPSSHFLTVFTASSFPCLHPTPLFCAHSASPQRPSIPRLNDPQNGDDTPIWYASEALMTLQRAYGLFPRIMGKGDAAKVILAWIQADLPFKVAVRTVIAKPPRAPPRSTLVAPHKSSR
jgi:hypothetical protein